MSSARHAIAKPLCISLLAALAMMAVWFTLSARMDDALSWFALVAAADIALLERWTRNRERDSARWIAPSVTAACCLASLWLITALSVSHASGFRLADSVRQMGFGLFRQLLELRLGPGDWLLLALAPVLAFVLSGSGAVNGRRRPT